MLLLFPWQQPLFPLLGDRGMVLRPHAHLYTETYASPTATNASRDTASQGHPLNNCPFYASLSPPAPPTTEHHQSSHLL